MVLMACNDTSKSVSQKPVKTQVEDTVIPAQTELVKRMSWLLGEWHFVSGQNHSMESWKKESDTSFLGQAFFLVGNDTASKESLRMVQRGGNLYYIATVKNQNNNEGVSFTLTDTSGQILFENPEHDFPQQISYKHVSKNYMVAKISGKVKGKLRSEEFPMIRK